MKTESGLFALLTLSLLDVEKSKYLKSHIGKTEEAIRAQHANEPIQKLCGKSESFLEIRQNFPAGTLACVLNESGLCVDAQLFLD